MITSPTKKFIKNPIFISYTSLNDFLKCKRSYYLKNIYRDPKSGLRVQIASPYLSLGSTVHDTARWFLDMKGQASLEQLEDKFRNFWLKYRGKRGGFESDEVEGDFGRRGLKMLSNFFKNWKILGSEMPPLNFPKYPLFEDVVLMGNMDFVGEQEDGSLHVLDFKTGLNDEKDPLQLYIYAILAEANLQKPVSKIGFWYLDRDSEPKEAVLDPLDKTLDFLKEKAIELKKAIKEGHWVCKNNTLPEGGLCRECQAYQDILDGKGEFVFTDYKFKKDIYYLPRST